MLRRASDFTTLQHSLESKFPSSSSQEVKLTHTVTKEYDAETGNKLINNFMIIKEIGRGVHGKVKLAQDLTTGELVAIKIVDKKNRRRQMGYSLLRGSQHQPGGQQQHPSKENELKIKREIAILKKCNHPNVVKLREVIDDPASRKIYMALEYTESGEIEWRDEYDKPVMTIDEARRIFRDIVNGLDYLHYQGIIHRDIKPANLLLSHDRVAKISDFGVSYYNELLAPHANTMMIHPNDEVFAKIDRELAETAGTPAFFAPELCCAGDSSSSLDIRRPRISKAIDVWALGVTLYCFIFGQCPFIAATEFELFDTIPTQPLTFPSKEDMGFEIDDTLKDLLLRLLTKDPEQRITLSQVKSHPWVTADLINPEDWINEADPHRYLPFIPAPELQLSTTESTTMMDRLRHSIRKLSFSFGGGNRRKSSAAVIPPSSRAILPNRPLSFQPNTTNTNSSSPNIHHHPVNTTTTTTNSNMHRLSQPSMSKQPSYSTSLLPHATSSVTPTVSLSTGHTLIFNSGLSSSIIPNPPPLHPLRPISPSYLSDEDEEEDDDRSSIHEYGIPRPSSTTSSRPGFSRRVSTASSTSGMGLTFGGYRGGMTPMEVVPPSK